MTYFEINWLLFSKPLTNLFVVGVNERHTSILQRDVAEHLMLPVLKFKDRFISLRNGSTINFLTSEQEQLGQHTRGYSNVEVVFGDNIKGDL